ncbi:MAG: alpha/beta hydrolase [bacterium]|nr:alpha/beta hydrolase [bacterium]
MKKLLIIIPLFFLCCSSETTVRPNSGDYVVLLHGLSRSADSMEKLARYLHEMGFAAINLDYPSSENNIHYLANTFLAKNLEAYCTDPEKKIHFVTHSLGGIIVRYYLKYNNSINTGRVVMLAPPNQGSEMSDVMAQTPMRWVLGPAITELGTGKNSIPQRLGPVNFDLGVIAGNISINWINSLFIIPGTDDGKVAVNRAGVKNMKDFLIVERSHPYIMKGDEVLEEVYYYIQHGQFKR